MMDDENSHTDGGEGVPAVIAAEIAEAQQQRYRLFARHMASCENATRAARLAGYSEASAYNQGWRLLQRPDVLAMVEEERQARAKRLEVTEDRILAAYAAIAFGDARRIAKWDDRGEGAITDSDDLTDDEAMMVQGVERQERYDKDGNPIVTVKVRLASRTAALDALARTKGMFREKLEIEGAGGVADEMAELRRRRAARRAASDKATPIDVEVIDNEGETNAGSGASAEGRAVDAGVGVLQGNSGVREHEEVGGDQGAHGRVAVGRLHDGMDGSGRPEQIAPGIARRFAAATPRDPDA